MCATACQQHHIQPQQLNQQQTSTENSPSMRRQPGQSQPAKLQTQQQNLQQAGENRRLLWLVDIKRPLIARECKKEITD